VVRSTAEQSATTTSMASSTSFWLGTARCGATPVLHPGEVPTRRRHAITETPPVEAALDELREALGEDRVEMGELVILGAQEKLARLRAERDDTAALRRRLGDRVRRRDIPADPGAADEVRRAGWARP
jgi:hypothetical protein